MIKQRTFYHRWAKIVLVMIALSCRGKTIIIKPLHPYTSETSVVSEGKSSKALFKYFYIENYSANDSQQLRTIQRFAFDQVNQNTKEYSQFEIHFYNKTKILNEKYRDTEDDELAWHTKDEILEFRWSHGEYLGYSKYVDGECVNCRDVIIEPIN